MEKVIEFAIGVAFFFVLIAAYRHFKNGGK